MNTKTSIDFDDYETIPSQVWRFIVAHKDVFTKSNAKYIQDKYSTRSSCNDQLIKHIVDSLDEMLRDYEIMGGHYTRLYMLDDIEKGLLPLNYKQHKDYILKIVEKENADIPREELRNLENALSDETMTISNGRNNKLYFYYPVSGGETCEHYSETIGGEIIQFQKDSFPTLYKLLSNVGYGLKITANIPYNYIFENERVNVMDNIIRVVLSIEETSCFNNTWMDYQIVSVKKIEYERIKSVKKVF